MSPASDRLGWHVMPMKRAVQSGRAGGTLIKGQMATEPGAGLYSGFSASGQDVWVDQAEYHGAGIVLSAVGARCGKAFKADGKWTAIANTHVLLPRKGFSRDYLWYVLNDENWWEKGGSAQPYVRVPSSLARDWAFPVLEQQQKIAAFLDRKTATIDDLIKKKERLIELLQERRQALITQAVTKGLDPKVPMKESGVLAVGPIPAHWRLTRVKLNVSLATSGSRGWADYYSDHGALFLQSGNLDGQLGLDLREVQHVALPPRTEGKRTRVLHGDVLVCITGGLTGNVGAVEGDLGEAYVNQHLCLLRPVVSRVHPMFLALALGSSMGQCQFEISSYGLKEGLALENVREVAFARPPQCEQAQIVAFLLNRMTELQRTIEKARSQVALLQEYRQALISAAVTGQLDVASEPIENDLGIRSEAQAT